MSHIFMKLEKMQLLREKGDPLIEFFRILLDNFASYRQGHGKVLLRGEGRKKFTG